jgi:hypothetical protein
MSGLIRKREDEHRDRLLRDFVRVITRLRDANELIQSSVGRSINVADQLFVQRFGSVERFQASSGEKKDQYIGSIARAEECFTNRWPTMAIGFSLFKMWLEALTEEDEALAKHLSRGLSALSAKGSGGMYCHSFTAANSPKLSVGEAISA